MPNSRTSPGWRKFRKPDLPADRRHARKEDTQYRGHHRKRRRHALLLKKSKEDRTKKGRSRIKLTTEDDWHLVAKDIAQDSAKYPGHNPHHDRYRGARLESERSLCAKDSEES